MSGSIFEDVGKFEQKLGLPKDFYRRLLGEDDWSFVIKLNALFEGAATHVLSTRLHAPKLVDAFAHHDRTARLERWRSYVSLTQSRQIKRP